MKKTKHLALYGEIFQNLEAKFKYIFLFSFFINIFMLAPTGYMLQVYDRVVNSRNHQTLLMLTILVVGVYALLECISWVRANMMQEIASKVDNQLRERLFFSLFEIDKKEGSLNGIRVFEDLRLVRDILPSNALAAVSDLPFAFITLILLFMIHPRVGWFAVATVLILILLAILNQKGMSEPLEKANASNNKAHQIASNLARNAEAISSMGMINNLQTRWMTHQKTAIAEQAKSSEVAGTYSVFSKLFQNLQSSLILGLGCWLALEGEISADGGLMIGGSILAGRVMSPMVTVITQWRSLINAYYAAQRINEILDAQGDKVVRMPLPSPNGHLKMENISFSIPGRDIPLLRGVSLFINPGEVLALVGASGSGKTTVARMAVGAWKPSHGKVRLDDADIENWDQQMLGPHIGYLAQTVDLFDGTIAENIARFGEIDMDAVIQAGKWVGLDKLISQMPDAYETQIGFEGAYLSGGIRQRIGLARAIYKLPKLIVLDEPNSSLDEEGDYALISLLKFLKQESCAVMVITHRRNLLSEATNMLVLIDGQVKLFGPREEVLKTLSGASNSSGEAAKKDK